MYETYYDTLKPYFGQEKLHSQYMVTDGFILIVNTKNIIKDLKNREDLFGYSNLRENHELFSNKNKNVNRKFKKRFPETFGLMNLFVWEIKCMHLNVEKTVKLK